MQQRASVLVRALAYVAFSSSGACYMAVGDAGEDLAATGSELNQPNDALLWPNGTATVCWSNDANTNTVPASLKYSSQSWVTQAISATANVNFLGWATCSGSNNNKLVLSYDPGDASSVTNYVDQFTPPKQGWLGLNDSTRIKFGVDFAANGSARTGAQIPVVHEFMHAIGFGHEFNRPDNTTHDCSAWQVSGGQPGNTHGTSYDHDSITNSGYCHENTQLSEQDGRGLRDAYGTFPNTELSSNRNSDGRLEIIYTYTGDVIYNRWQFSSGTGPWVGPYLLGAPYNAAKQVVLGKSSGGSLEAFYIGTDDVVYHNPNSGSGWSGEMPLRTTSNKGKRLVVANNSFGMQVVYIGTDNRLYTIRQQPVLGDWSTAAAIGDASVSAKELAIGKNADGRLEVFYSDASDVLRHAWMSAPGGVTWEGFQPLGTGNNKAKQLRVASNLDGRMEVVYIGTDNVLYHNWQISPSAGWNGQGFLATTQTTGKQLAIEKDSRNRLEVVFTDTSDVLRHVRQTAANQGWTSPSLLAGAGNKAKRMTLVANQNRNLELIYAGANNLLYHISQDSNANWGAESELE